MANLGNFRAYANADCVGDKIKLPESISQRLLSIPNISYPLCFELSVPISREDMLNAMQMGQPKPIRKVIHCGILDFTAGEGCICLPKWIMDNLNISDSQTLNVINITLPKGRYVKLQPHKLLKDIKTKQKLESSLRNFTTLTENTTITIQSMNNIKLNILKVKPNKNNLNSIQIIDTDLVVEFEVALDGNTNTNQWFNRDLFINNNDKMEDIVNDKVKKSEFRFYKLLLSGSGIDNIKITVTPTDNKYDLDLYASWNNYEPGTTTDNYDYHCVEHGSAQIIVNTNDKNNNNNNKNMDVDDNENKNKHLYISVHGFENDSIDIDNNENKQNDNDHDIDINYTLNITNISMNDIEIKELYRASSLQTHEIEEKMDNNSNNNNNNNSEQDIPLSTDSDKQFCINCHRFVNKWSYDRHHQHCIKQFKFCGSCKKVIKIDEIEKHNKTLHNDLKCKMCKETISGGKQTLISHQKYECLKRPVTCDYCQLPFPYINFDEHESMCGSRTELCIHCNQYIALSIIQQHTIDVHGMEYEIPSGIARMKSDDSVEYSSFSGLGGYGAPDRNYEDMANNNDNNKDRTNIKERWICSSCDYNNRPNHTICKICKVKKTKYMKKVSEIDDPKKKKNITPIKKKDNIEKIGGNAINIPNRNYDALLNKDNNNNNNDISIPSVKPPLIQYNDKNSNKNKKKNDDSDMIVSSGVDPSQIPQRDYDKMLNAEEIDDTAAFIPVVDNNNNNNNITDDIDMQNIDDNDNDNDEMFTKNIDNIPNRNYENMFQQQQQEQQYDEAMEQQMLIEKLTKQFENENKNKKKPQYRAETAIVPQRNYDKLIQTAQNNNENNNNDNDNDNDVNMTQNNQQIVMATSSTGYWVCSSDECDHLNKSTRNNCSVCHTLKPTYRRTASLLDDSIDQLGLENRWVCKNCDGLNKGSRNKCVYCKEIKSYKPNSKSAAKKVIQSTKKSKIESGIFNDIERWVCPDKECNFLNKGSRLQCQVCHEQRKDTHIVWGDKVKNKNNDNNNDNGVNINENKNKKINNNNDDKNKKVGYSHPLEARMMGMDVDQIHNVKVGNNNNTGDDNTGDDVLEWPCPICTFLNKGMNCEMCGCPKDGQ